MKTKNPIAGFLLPLLRPGGTVEELAEQLVRDIAARPDNGAREFVFDANADPSPATRRLIRPVLASLAVKSAAEAGIAVNLYGGPLSFQRPGPHGTVWVVGRFENRADCARIALRRSGSPPDERNGAAVNAPLSDALLAGYLDDTLSEAETARIEQELRRSEPLRERLQRLMQDNDRGEHSVGAIWRRSRLTCLSRDQLGSFVLGVLDDDLHDYAAFHLNDVGCAYCQANLADLQNQQREEATQVKERRRRYFQSSADLLRPEKKA